MKKTSRYFYLVMLIVNILFTTYLVYGWVNSKPVTPTIPSNVLTENKLVRAEISKLTETTESKQVMVALLSSEVSICENNKLADFFRSIRRKKSTIKLVILFSNNNSEQEIATFKENFKLDFEVAKMSSELNEYWEQTSRKYQTPGIVITSDQNNLYTSTDFTELKKIVEAYK